MKRNVRVSERKLNGVVWRSPKLQNRNPVWTWSVWGSLGGIWENVEEKNGNSMVAVAENHHHSLFFF